MAINEMLSTYSNYAFTTSVVIYVLAMTLYLGEQAFGRLAGSRATAARSERELVGAGAGGAGETVTDTPADTPTEPSSVREFPDAGRGRADRFGRMGVALTVLGVLVHVTSIALRGFATGRWPLGNMYEYLSFICLVAVVASLVMMRRFAVRRIAAFVLLPVVILMFLGGTVLYAVAAPVQP
ncbi:MAG: c-type cytochrome biogenesis protein CcsB, partial [Sciscionella sp.]